LARKIGKNIINFPLAKIEDVRNLKKFIKLSQKLKTTVTIYNIDHATNETLNAFLKILEEPQRNINYIITFTS